jgi:hypothetical protein
LQSICATDPSTGGVATLLRLLDVKSIRVTIAVSIKCGLLSRRQRLAAVVELVELLGVADASTGGMATLLRLLDVKSIRVTIAVSVKCGLLNDNDLLLLLSLLNYLVSLPFP